MNCSHFHTLYPSFIPSLPLPPFSKGPPCVLMSLFWVWPLSRVSSWTWVGDYSGKLAQLLSYQATPLKKLISPPLTTNSPSWRCEASWTLPTCSEMSPILCRSCTDDYSCSEFLSTPAVSCPEDSFVFCLVFFVPFYKKFWWRQRYTIKSYYHVN